MDIKLALFNKVEYCFSLAEAYFETEIPRPKISFDIRGQDAGRAYFSFNTEEPESAKLKFNEILFFQNSEEFLENIVPHECSHLIVYEMFGRKVKPHGDEWKGIMSGLFGLEPKVMHSLDVKDVTNKPFVYACACLGKGELSIGTRQHNNIQKGGEYYCQACKSRLSFLYKKDVPVKIKKIDQGEISGLYIYSQKDVLDEDIANRMDFILGRRKPAALYLSPDAKRNASVNEWIKGRRVKGRVRSELILTDLEYSGSHVDHVVAIVNELMPNERQALEDLQNNGKKVRLLKCG